MWESDAENESGVDPAWTYCGSTATLEVSPY